MLGPILETNMSALEGTGTSIDILGLIWCLQEKKLRRCYKVKSDICKIPRCLLKISMEFLFYFCTTRSSKGVQS